MKDQIISFETAVLAKEKGFNIECEKYYNTTTKECWTNNWLDGEFPHVDAAYAPTQSLLQKWLRGKHDIFVRVDTININKYYHFINITNYNGNKDGLIKYCSKENNYGFNKYENALEEGLKIALRLLPNE